MERPNNFQFILWSNSFWTPLHIMAVILITYNITTFCIVVNAEYVVQIIITFVYLWLWFHRAIEQQDRFSTYASLALKDNVQSVFVFVFSSVDIIFERTAINKINWWIWFMLTLLDSSNYWQQLRISGKKKYDDSNNRVSYRRQMKKNVQTDSF